MEYEGRTLQRFEAKYLVSESKASAVAWYIQPFVRADEHAGQDAEYWVNSVYWDAPDLCLYRSSVCGERNRFKLRVRSYGRNGNGHVLLEIKRRLAQVIRKERAWMDTVGAEALLQAGVVTAPHDQALEDVDIVASHRFRNLVESLSAGPRVCVGYAREAYVSTFDESPVRVTFDRHIECLPATTDERLGPQTDTISSPVITSGVVMEIKFTDRAPSWVRRTIREFNLERQSISKYVLAVNVLKRQGIGLGRLRGAATQ